MNPFEFYRALAKLTPDKLRELGVVAVQENEQKVVLDSILTNHPNYLTNRETPSAGKTFIGNDIVGTENFSDWDDSYKFHDNLKFLEENNIEFTSTGKGFEAIKANFNEDDWIAPHARTLDEKTIDKITVDFIKLVKQQIIK